MYFVLHILIGVILDVNWYFTFDRPLSPRLGLIINTPSEKRVATAPNPISSKTQCIKYLSLCCHFVLCFECPWIADSDCSWFSMCPGRGAASSCCHHYGRSPHGDESARSVPAGGPSPSTETHTETAKIAESQTWWSLEQQWQDFMNVWQNHLMCSA